MRTDSRKYCQLVNDAVFLCNESLFVVSAAATSAFQFKQGVATACLSVRDSKSTGFHMNFRFENELQDFKADFWISKWISGFQSGFLDFKVDFWISKWISGFQSGFLDFKVDFWISKWISGFQVQVPLGVWFLIECRLLAN